MKIFANHLASVGFAALLLTSCASSKTVTTTPDEKDDRVTIKMDDTKSTDTNQVEVGNNNSLQLVDYLRRVPGLQINQRGGTVDVMVRGVTSMTGNNSPLYVINNSAIGNSYSEAVNAVDVNDIKSVNVIKGAEGQQMYGMRGANGVIQILTKKK